MQRTRQKQSRIGAFRIKPKRKSGAKPTLKERWETYNTIASLFYKISAAIGAIVVFAYLFEIRFFPAGLTAAEVIFFVFVAMGFGLIYLVLLGFGAVSAIWLVNLIVWFRNSLRFRRRRGKKGWRAWCIPKKWQIRWAHRVRFRSTRLSRRGFHPLHSELRGVVYTAVSILLCLFLVSLTLTAGASSVQRLMGGIFVGGFIALMFSNGEARSGQNRPAKKGYWTSAWFRLLLAVVLPLIILIMLRGAMDLVHVVFQQLGIRMMNVSVEVPVTELESVERISDALNRPLLDCHRSSKGSRLLIHHVNVLWTGVGSTTYLSLEVDNPVRPGWFGPDPKPLQEAMLRLDTSSVHVLEAMPPLNPCFDLPDDMLFGTAKYELTPEADTTLKALVSSIQADGRLDRIVVRGHSDSRRIGGQMEREVGDNQRLSERRAEAVAAELRKLLNIPGLNITSEGAGSREPKVNCPAGAATTPYEAQQCNAPNRRVEIRITYAANPKSVTGRAQQRQQ
ncbi:OmpA family protein [Paraburkholderia tropica]|uniref:OmpA family protein n=1 Tax=Paraburkholderia tropica TaxID=92647 RepID=UPI001622AE80|nr:OmpA family protein [Paraburkholderia tropica]MBB2984658.1 outer membrane protein OmpA-like peptidoglycan-associated protein [Paraburkholderia tropica]